MGQHPGEEGPPGRKVWGQLSGPGQASGCGACGARRQGPPGEGSTCRQHRGGAGAGEPGQPAASLEEETPRVGQGIGAARPAAFAGKGSRSF